MNLHVLLASALLALSASAQSLTYVVAMNSGEEAPPINSPATGLATLTVDATSGAFQVSGTYANLLGAATQAHIHAPARRASFGLAAVALSVSGGASGTLSGSGTLPPAVLAAVLDGLAYLNVHSATFVGGEIRGQIDTVPGSGTPGAPWLVATGAPAPAGFMQILCPPMSGAAVLLLGAALPAGATVPLPPGLVCTSPTSAGLDLLLPLLVVPGRGINLTLPGNVGNIHFAVQCVFVTATNCVDLSGARRIAVRP